MLHSVNKKKSWFLFHSFSECNCHNKAEDCYYNQSIADQKRSMDIHGQYIGGGVCLNCTQHTTGINCEMCADGYFRPHKVRFRKYHSSVLVNYNMVSCLFVYFSWLWLIYWFFISYRIAKNYRGFFCKWHDTKAFRKNQNACSVVWEGRSSCWRRKL